MNTRIRATLAAGSLLAFALVAIGCSSGDGGDSDFSDAETVSQTFPYSGHALTIDAGTSDLVIVSGGSDEVKVDRQIAGTVNNESPDAKETLTGDSLNLSVDCNGFAIGCKGRFTVTVPDDVTVTAQNKNSLIKASDFSADLTVSAVNGHADLTQISSSTLTLTGKDMVVSGRELSATTVTTDTRNGDIDLTFSDAPDRVEINSKDGNVSLALPDAEYRVDVTTKKGKDDVSVPRSNSSTHIISVTTRNGDVTITPAS